MPSVIVVCHDSPTRDTCPTLYRTVDGQYYVQGYLVTDAEVLAEMSIPDGEAVVQITPELVRLIVQSAGQAATEPAVVQAPGVAPAATHQAP